MINSPQPDSSGSSEQDVELLSTYLDDALTAAERVNLERRLNAEPRLKAELEDLRTVRDLLNQLEPVPLPRSFTLDPAQFARSRPFFPLTWLMQLGSGLAGLALVLLASVQILTAGAVPLAVPAQMAPAAEMAPAAAQPTEAATAGMMMAEATAAPMAAMEAPASTAAPAATQAPVAESMPAALPAAPPAAGSAAGGSAGSPAGNSSAPTSDGTTTGSAMNERTAPTDQAIIAMADQATKQSPYGSDAPVASNPNSVGLPINPAFTLALGLVLIAAAVGWNFLSRRN